MTAQTKAIESELKKHRGVNVKNNRLYVHFNLPGQKYQKKVALGLPVTITNIRCAANTLSCVKRDIANGLFSVNPDEFWLKNFPNNAKNRKLTKSVEECFEEYEVENKNEITDSMKDKLRSSLNWLKSFKLAGKSINEISKVTLDDIRKLSVTTRKVVTVNEYTQTFRKITQHAYDKGYIKIDPTKILKKLKRDDVNLSKEDKKVIPFTTAELWSLLEVIHIPQTKVMVELLAWTGMRHGELKALAWEDIDLVAGSLKVRFNLTRKGNLKPPKTPAGIRTINLLPRALELLKEQAEHSYKFPARKDIIHLANQKSYAVNRRRVFLSRGNQPFKRPEVTTTPDQWKNWLIKANLTHRPAYQLRHTFASQMLMAKADPAWLAPQMGHNDWGMIRKIYAKWINEEKPDYIKTLAQNLGQTFDISSSSELS